MKIVMTSYMSDGKDINYNPGDIAEFDDAEAARLISVGGAREMTEAEHYAEAKRNSIAQLQDMTVAELTKIADDNKIDLAGQTKKAEIVAAIVLALEAREAAARKPVA